MKSCPKCSRVYADDGLNFCLDDGEWLSETKEPNDAPTAIQSSAELFSLSSSRPKKTEDHTTVPPTASNGGHRLLSTPRNIVVLALLAIIVAAAAFFGYRYYHLSSSPMTSIAVLPFVNRSAEADTQYLSEGLAESLIYRLSQLPDLKVSPTSSVFRYEDKDVDPVTAGNELGVHAVLWGRLVQHGDNITISANLVDVQDNRLIWGEQYDRKMSDLLSTQREIAQEIVENLKVKVSPQERGLSKHYTEDNEAYQLYLKGRYYWNKRTSEGLQKSLEYYQKAIDKDPNFALAYAGMADSYNIQGGPESGGDIPPNDILPKAKTAAQKAIDLDDSLAEPHASLALTLFFYDHDWVGSEREFKKALERNPNYPTAHQWYAIYLEGLGRTDEAVKEIKLAEQLEPLSLPINVWYGRVLCDNGRTDDGLQQFRKTLDLDPNYLATLNRLALLYADQGMYDEAVETAQTLIKLFPDKPIGAGTLGYVYAKGGKRKEAEDRLAELLRVSREQYVSPAMIAGIYTALNDKDSAFIWLDKAVEGHDFLTVRIKVDQRFVNLRSDPRFEALTKRIGLP